MLADWNGLDAGTLVAFASRLPQLTILGQWRGYNILVYYLASNDNNIEVWWSVVDLTFIKLSTQHIIDYMPTTIESMLIVFIVTFYYILVNKTEMVNFIESLLLSSVIIVYNRYDSYNSHNSNAYQVYILFSQVGTNPKGVLKGLPGNLYFWRD